MTFKRNSTELMYARGLARTKQVKPTVEFRIRSAHSGTHHLLASVQLNGLPVNGAQVKATIRPLDQNHSAIEVELLDDGVLSKDKGWMDITRNDGVYSKLINYTSGPAVIHLTAVSRDNVTYTVSTNYNASAGATWDTVDVPANQRQLVESFNVDAWRIVNRTETVDPGSPPENSKLLIYVCMGLLALITMILLAIAGILRLACRGKAVR